MGLSKFSANIAYTSDEGCKYESKFKQNPSTPEADKVLLDTIEHLAWMGAVGGQADATKEAFERGHKQGVDRRAYLDGLNKEPQQ
ncbi:hypothetical protein ACG94V_15385 [Acinetobacter sp. ULE_I001]|uniref:hypothetical protein n=1 Tax=unclassified Acinetobacter TaxID=196816 RepID=UPI003AF7406C